MPHVWVPIFLLLRGDRQPSHRGSKPSQTWLLETNEPWLQVHRSGSFQGKPQPSPNHICNSMRSDGRSEGGLQVLAKSGRYLIWNSGNDGVWSLGKWLIDDWKVLLIDRAEIKILVFVLLLVLAVKNTEFYACEEKCASFGLLGEEVAWGRYYRHHARWLFYLPSRSLTRTREKLRRTRPTHKIHPQGPGLKAQTLEIILQY